MQTMKIIGFRIKKQHKHVIQKMLDAAEIPAAILPGSTNIELTGNSAVTVENCKGIVDYDACYIRLSAGRYPITVYGEGLMLANLSDSALMIKGKINSIELC